MASQRALFTEIEQRLFAGEPRGFQYQEQIISEEVEASLAAELGQLALRPFEFHGYLGNRRVVNFGLKYDFSRRSVQRAEDMPSFLDDLLNRAASFAGCEKDAFRQVGVNEYRAGAGIGWHKDKPEFGIIVGVSLLAPSTMVSQAAQQRVDPDIARLEASLHLHPLRGGPKRLGTQYSTTRRAAIFNYVPHALEYLDTTQFAESG